ncbi:MAG: GGDEF domain-containing protein [bacterium]|nr:GGDEF domain-containing protein [bacterium]
MADQPFVPEQDTNTKTVSLAQLSSETANGEQSCLVVLRGPELGRRTELNGPTLSIGRGSDCDLPVRVSNVSRYHCRIEVRDSRTFVRDLGSTNGTRLNGFSMPPNEDFVIEGGDLLQVGDCVFKFLDGGSVETRFHEEVYRRVVVDNLTQVHNRRFFVEFLEKEISRCRRHSRSLCLLLIDIDHFKRVNDEIGHTAGDEVLRRVASCLASHARREECLARYGGEEFAMVLPESRTDGARQLAARLRESIEALNPEIEGKTVPITVSIGLAEWDDSMQAVEDMVRAADTRLYEAKDAGRNQVAG